MEFERALYNIYERCLDGLWEQEEAAAPGDNRISRMKPCQTAERIFLIFSMIALVTLLVLHTSFVGHTGCFPELLSIALLQQLDTNETDMQRYLAAHSSASLRRINTLDVPDDVIIQIRVKGKYFYGVDDVSRHDTPPGYGLLRGSHGNGTATNSSVVNRATVYDEQFDYYFTRIPAILGLSEEHRRKHFFREINVTLSGSECFGSENFLQPLLFFSGIDVVVQNYVKNTVR